MSTRALNQVEAERVRDRIVELLEEKGSEKAVGDYVGLSQQYVGKVKSRQATPGYHAATKIAEADRVPVEALLGGAPPHLYRAMAERRWPAYVMVAGTHLALTVPRSREREVDYWRDFLRRLEEAMVEVARGPRSGR